MNLPPVKRLRVVIRGAVQGVGFRPFVHRLATELEFTGWVNNSPQGVFIEMEGSSAKLEACLRRLEAEKPTHSFIQSLEATWLDPVGYETFEIRPSKNDGGKSALILPDIATCPDCWREIFDPANRRYRYPFTNCTHCGPRFTIIQSLPYDRANTSMHRFTMCPECQAEYDDPTNRRFHAQPNACPCCGPRLEFWSRAGEAIFGGHEALLAAANAIRRGQIAAVKGIGGFHLFVDARNERAIAMLRQRKNREEKPFALLFSTLQTVAAVCEVSHQEARALCSPEAPIVLLKKLRHCSTGVAASVAPGNPNLGVMLPANPLHHLLMHELKHPVVATSGNLNDEPICTDEQEALSRLAGIADWFLVHDRPIVRHVDDSIVRLTLGREMVLRRARGFAPLPISLSPSTSAPRNKTILAVGAHLKNSVALAIGNQIFPSQHIGDLAAEPAINAFRSVICDFETLYEVKPEVIAYDLHPDYICTRIAQSLPGQKVGVQHHEAHVLSCLAENEQSPPALGVAWDGTGYGYDHTIWGSEFFLITKTEIKRVAHFRPFPLPGGDAAVKEPRRVATGLLYSLYGEEVFDRRELACFAAFSPQELAAIKTMLSRQINSPFCCSTGRIFDAVASLINLRQQIRFEGQAAMELEFALDGYYTEDFYPIPLVPNGSILVLDWAPMLQAVIKDVANGLSTGAISARFHNSLAEAIVMVAKKVELPRVLLSGGCFQNKYLAERTVKRLCENDFQPYWHQRVPPNDGGIALGQIMAALRSDA